MFRDRIKELRRVRAGDLVPHPRNWRTHPPQQQVAIRAMLDEVGWADALIAREKDGAIELVDGHLRAGLDAETLVPVLIVDLSDEEADKVLLTLDPLANMAIPDLDAVRLLAERVPFFQNDSLREMIGELCAQGLEQLAHGNNDQRRLDELWIACPKCGAKFSR